MSGKPIRRLLVDFYQECEVVGRENIGNLLLRPVLRYAVRRGHNGMFDPAAWQNVALSPLFVVACVLAEMLEEHRVVQQALRSAESTKKAHRKELLEMHRRRVDVQARLKEVRAAPLYRPPASRTLARGQAGFIAGDTSPTHAVPPPHTHYSCIYIASHL